MAEISINPLKVLGKIKPMHCINGGPLKALLPGGMDNCKEFKEIKFPYIRNHDVSFEANFGMEHIVDVSAIFPDFSKNAYSESSYDFTLTDEYICRLYEVGSKPFYRLGQKIEHWSKKYGSIPPTDFQKWAIVCEHIIKHYTEGWNNGFHYDMEYWEIWNEPDNVPACWTETIERFYELYEITAKHLKKGFPNIKIGGPAFAEWSVDNGTVRKFIEHMGTKNIPIDFLSWHTYSKNIEDFTRREREVRNALDSSGYTNTESILDEWNYLVTWENPLETQQNICSISGAALASALMCTMQNTSIDMLMYYTVQPGRWNGLFDFYTLKKLKSYFVFLMFSRLYELQKQIETESNDKEIYAIAASDNESIAAMITYYTCVDAASKKTVTVEITGSRQLKSYILDKENDMKYLGMVSGKTSFILEPNSVLFLSDEE